MDYAHGGGRRTNASPSLAFVLPLFDRLSLAAEARAIRDLLSA
jgi:hypothetical protein